MPSPRHARNPSSRSRRRFLGGIAGASIAPALSPFLMPGTALAQSAKLGTADYGVASIDPLYAMAYVAAKKGYFAQAGLDVRPLNAQSGPRAKQMLAAGQLFAATSGVNDPVSLTIAGKQAVLVAGFDNRIAFANILTTKKLHEGGLKDIRSLAGRSIGVTQPQSATWLMAMYLADRAGIKDKVQVRALGDFSTMLGAVKSGSVDCCTATYSMLNKAKEEGWGVPLFDVTDDASWNSTFGGDVPGVGLYVMQDSIDKRPEAVQALVTGIVKASDFIRQTAPGDIVSLIEEEYLPGYGRQLSIDSVSVFKKIWSGDNLITPQHYARLMDVMGGRQITPQEMKQVPYEKMVNMSFVKRARGLA
ncbi:ABC transporter substrate-binding protein [Variovorax paradoxus]|uniref:ABC transporter substrate-binding protein n=1 Tax=Variovorax paradoxus TaxID=34073 RepID=UPI001ABD2B4A